MKQIKIVRMEWNIELSATDWLKGVYEEVPLQYAGDYPASSG